MTIPSVVIGAYCLVLGFAARELWYAVLRKLMLRHQARRALRRYMRTLRMASD